MDRAQKLVRCPPPTRVPRSRPTGPPEPPLAVSWRRCSGRLATQPHAEGPSVGRHVPTNSPSIPAESRASPAHASGGEREMEWRKRRRRVNSSRPTLDAGVHVGSTPVWCAGRTPLLRGSLTGSPSLWGCPRHKGKGAGPTRQEKTRQHGQGRPLWPHRG